MKLLRNFGCLIAFLASGLFSQEIFSQENRVSLIQDARFEKLLIEKRKINASLYSVDRFKIQIFNGDNETAKKTLTAFKKEFKMFDATILFSTPTYKVVVGNFKTRIEAEKNLIDVRKIYKNALLLRPQ